VAGERAALPFHLWIQTGLKSSIQSSGGVLSIQDPLNLPFSQRIRALLTSRVHS